MGVLSWFWTRDNFYLSTSLENVACFKNDEKRPKTKDNLANFIKIMPKPEKQGLKPFYRGCYVGFWYKRTFTYQPASQPRKCCSP